MEVESCKGTIGVSPDTSKTLNKILNYSLVQQCYQYAIYYSDMAKKAAPVVKSGCDFVESTIRKGVEWVQPKIEPVLQSKMYHRVDDFAFHQVEKVEQIATNLAKWSEKKKRNG